MPNLDADIAAPNNRKVTTKSETLRILDVYDGMGEWEDFHAHPRYSIFLQWGIPMVDVDHGDEGSVLSGGEAGAEEDVSFTVYYALPQWLHAVINGDTMNLTTAPNCLLEIAPEGCGGFFFRAEFLGAQSACDWC